MKLIQIICGLAFPMFIVGCNGATMDVVNKLPEEMKEVEYSKLVKAHKQCRSNVLISKHADKIFSELRRRDELSLSKTKSLDDFLLAEKQSFYLQFVGRLYNYSGIGLHYTLTAETIRNARRKWYVETHKLSDGTKQLILDGRFATGWTTDHLLASMGRPKDINRTVTRNRVHEQWIYYSGYYIYFENGVLSSWQD